MTDGRRPRVVLVGPPGAGKTTVGKALARRLGLEFTDVDALIVERAGKPISDIFTQDGEQAFRELEREVVAEALATTTGVLALGGGSVLAVETRQRLRGHEVVYLTVGLADGLRRTGMSTARPLLVGVNPRATFRALLEARTPLYREVATIEIDTVRRNTNQVARAVLEAMGAADPDAPLSPEDELPGDSDVPPEEGMPIEITTSAGTALGGPAEAQRP
ncbi:shikimate kinase [Pseudonocardia sp.]|uniref:shikimate kinase n=1 Tax=Pseudonocardia sp. TaxID=60912 RepID=UPI003D0ECE0B